ncbi:alanine dehydrogenase [Saccharopolyspora sp. WRP15-2]|uniref:Alanine dehydrogenase n=1 Tax=Saccharopolyspora oryzae TaxID=2997343 RepID=A0ABT4UWU3_9PSEU|nr:alanine dehydrogenase [Saccharopolyspora oryzae]MDA3626186.1 alanine dehydrogenase [Saccharopolyspora oryzae]
MPKLVIGVPKEIKDNENRVSVQPDGVAELVHQGHEVLVETNAGAGSRFTDAEFTAAGAAILPDADEVFAGADLIVKVKEPIPAEYHRFREGQQLFTYLHLAADKPLTEFLVERKIDSIAYETVQTADGKLPLLTPMSEVAGRMAVQAAAHHLESPSGGAGLLLGGVPGTPAAKVLIIGGGVSGTEAAKIAAGMRAMVRVLDTNPSRLAYLADIFGGRLDLVVPNRTRLAEYIAESDVVIGAVLVPGAKAPKLVTREMIARMRPGSVVVDIAIDQGGCFETSRATTHSDPTYVVDGVIHYCVANIPGAVARTSTLALTSATLPYLIKVAGQGIRAAARQDEALARGLSTLGGALVNEPVAQAHDLTFTDPATALAGDPRQGA